MMGVEVFITWTPFLFIVDLKNACVKSKMVKHLNGQVTRKVKHPGMSNPILSNFQKKETLVIS